MDRTTVAISGRCGECDGPLPPRICGVDTQVRLEKTLERKGMTVVAVADDADWVVPECRVYARDTEMCAVRDGLPVVERALLLSLRKEADGPVSRHMNRKLSGTVTRMLMNTRIRPNHMTVLCILLGVSSGFVVALGGYWAGVIGALLLQSQSVLDGCDGELSRLRFQGSKFGEWLDTISDDASNFSFLIGCTYVATTGWVQNLGIAGAAAFVTTQVILYYALATVYHSGNLQAFKWDTGEKSGLFAKMEWMFKRDFFCLMFLGLALVGVLDVAVVVFSFGTIVTAITLFLQIAKWGLGPPKRQ